MPKPQQIELSEAGIVIPIIYEDRAVLALDKPAGWMLAPDTWDRTGRNLQLALQSSMNAGDFWARSRNLKFLRFIHRLDAETTGLTLFAKSQGALSAYSELFEERKVEKTYLAVVEGKPAQSDWGCSLSLAPDPSHKGQMMIIKEGRVPDRVPMDSVKQAETLFKALLSSPRGTLVEAHPLTGRTHQIRVHLMATGHPILGDPLYGSAQAAISKGRQKLALRAVRLSFPDPFQRRQTFINAPSGDFLGEYGFTNGWHPPGRETVEPQGVHSPKATGAPAKTPRAILPMS